MAMVLLLGSYQVVWAQETETPEEGTTEKVMHPVYINLQGNGISIDAPKEVADGEDLRFKVVIGDATGLILKVYQGRESADVMRDGGDMIVRNVTGAILISVSQDSYFTVDGVGYRTYVSSVNAFPQQVETAPSSSVELKGFVEHDGVTYRVENYFGCYDWFDNITSFTLPNTSMFYSPNAMSGMSGLKELHVKALSPDKYHDINDAFGNKDLSGVTLYVPQGCAGNYTGEPWSRFGSIKEEEAPTEFPVYMLGSGVADYSPRTARKGEDLTVTFTLEPGYYSMAEGSYSVSGNLVDSDQGIGVVASNRTYKDDQFTYVLWDEMSTAGIIATSLPSDTEELFIPAYVTNSEGNTYIVGNIVGSPFADLTNLKKLTIEGNTDLGFSTFTTCASLTEIHCLSELPHKVYSSSFSDAVRNSCVVYVPKGCVDIYRNNSDWGMFANIVEEVTTIEHTVAYDLTNLTLKEEEISSVAQGGELKFTLVPEEGYMLPSAIEIAGVTEDGYIYDATTGEVTIPSVTANLTITASAVEIISEDETVTGEKEQLIIKKEEGEGTEGTPKDPIEVSLSGVTSGSLTVDATTSTVLTLSGENDLGEVTNEGTLVIQAAEGATLAEGTTIANEGTLTDETGLVTSVTGTAALAIFPVDETRALPSPSNGRSGTRRRALGKMSRLLPRRMNW